MTLTKRINSEGLPICLECGFQSMGQAAGKLRSSRTGLHQCSADCLSICFEGLRGRLAHPPLSTDRRAATALTRCDCPRLLQIGPPALTGPPDMRNVCIDAY